MAIDLSEFNTNMVANMANTVNNMSTNCNYYLYKVCVGILFCTEVEVLDFIMNSVIRKKQFLNLKGLITKTYKLNLNQIQVRIFPENKIGQEQ